MFTEIRLACYRFILSPDMQGLLLPTFKGNLFLHQKFKSTLYEQSCKIARKKCNDCFLSLHCPYACFYEKLDGIAWGTRSFGALPAPFTWQFPLEKKIEYRNQETVTFRLILIGSGIQFLETFIRTFCEFAGQGLESSAGSFTLRNVIAENPFTGQRQLVFQDKLNGIRKTEVLISGKEIEIWCKKTPPVNRLSLLFLTPTLLKKDREEEAQELQFYYLIKDLFRRTSLFYYFYHDRKEMALSYYNFMESAKKVEKVHDYSRFVHWKKEMKDVSGFRGLLGKVEYSGFLQEFYPLLKLGEFIHLGENTAFGLGRYRIKLSLKRERRKVPLGTETNESHFS